MGYYLNAGLDKNEYPVISCYAMGCVKEKPKTECTLAASIIEKDKKIFFCSDDTNENIIEVKSDKKAPSYEKINFNEIISKFGKKFYIDINNDYTFKVRNDGSVILLSEAVLPNCGYSICEGSNCNYRCSAELDSDQYCIDMNSVIHLTKSIDETNTSYTCSVLVNSNNNESATSLVKAIVYYFSDDFKEITSITPNTENISIAYKCYYDTNSNVAKSCEPMTGTINDGNNIIQCSGWLEEYCSVKESKEKTNITTITSTSTPISSSTNTSTQIPQNNSDEIQDVDLNKENNSNIESGSYSLSPNISFIYIFFIVFILFVQYYII